MIPTMSYPTIVNGPRGTPVLGNASDLSRDSLRFLYRCSQEYGDLVSLRFFWKPVLFVNRPDYIEQVLTKNHRNVVKDLPQRANHALIGDGLFLSEGDFWRRQRRMMQPPFHRERIAGYGKTMVAWAERLLASWHDGETRQIYHDMSQVTMGVVAQTLFDTDVWGDASEVTESLGVVLDCLNRRVRSVEILLPDWLPTPIQLRLSRARRRIDKVIYRMIAERRAALDDRGDLLSLLLQAEDDDGARMTDLQVRDEVMTIFVGGYETAADLLTWIWYLLSQHPDVECKLVDELATLGGAPPTVADLPRLTYTGRIVSEALRLYPPAPALGREAIADFEIGGYRVAKGTDILVSQWVMHRDTRYFARPEAFDPDRWADGLASRLPRFAYFPFGGGPRLCIGHSFATMEATLVLATIAQAFHVELTSDRPVEVEEIPTLRPKNGIEVVVHRR